MKMPVPPVLAKTRKPAGRNSIVPVQNNRKPLTRSASAKTPQIVSLLPLEQPGRDLIGNVAAGKQKRFSDPQNGDDVLRTRLIFSAEVSAVRPFDQGK